MQPHQNEEKPSLLNNIVKKEEDSPFVCTVKQETSTTDESRQFVSPTFDSPVKRPLIDSQHEMVTPNSKRMKQEKENPSFWANKERLLLSNKTSLQNIVSEVAYSFASNNCAKSASFHGFESTNRALSCEDDTATSESSPRIAGSTTDVKTAYGVLATTVGCRKEEISALSTAAQVQNERSKHVLAPKPVLRPLKSKDSGISEGLAYDHNLFPKLVGVHSILSPTSGPPDVDTFHDSRQTRDAPWFKTFDQNQLTNGSSLLQIAENTPTTASNVSVIRHGTADKGHSMTKNTDRIMSHVPTLLSHTQMTTTNDVNLYKRDVLESYKIHAQNTPRTLPIAPLALATDYLPDLSIDFSPTRADLSDPWVKANKNSQRKLTEPKPTSQSVARSSAVSVSHTSLHEEPSAASAASAYAHALDRGRRNTVNSTSQLPPVSSQVSSRAHDQTYPSKKKSSSTSSKNLKSVNMKEVVNIYRMAAIASSCESQSKNTSDTKSQEPCDLLFSFTKPNGKSDLFLVIKDEVFAVKRFDYKGVSYLIHTDGKGKTSILAKLPEEEKWKLENNGTGASSGQQSPGKRASTSDITSSDSKQSNCPTSQGFTSQPPTEASLSVTALKNSLAQTTSRDTTHAMCSGMRTQIDNDRPTSFSRNDKLNSERRQLLKQLLKGIRAEASSHSQRPLATNLPQSPADGQQCCSSQACADRQERHRTSAVPSPTPRSAHASSDSWGNQQHTMDPNLTARKERNHERNVYSQELFADSTAESTYNGNQAFSTRHRNHLNKEIVEEDSLETFAYCSPSLINQNRTWKKLKLMDYIARRLASKLEPAPSTVDSLDCSHSGSRRSDVTRQISNTTMANGSSIRTTDALNSRFHEELPQHQQCQHIMELLVGTRANHSLNMDGVHSSPRGAVESSRVAQTLNATSPTQLGFNMPQSVIHRLVNLEDETSTRRASTPKVDQQRSVYFDTTSDWFRHKDCRSDFTGQQLLNNRMSISGLQSNYSRTALSPVPSENVVNGFIQEPRHLGKNTALQGEQYYTNSVLDGAAMPSSNCHSFMSQTSDNGISVSVRTGQQHFNGTRHPGHTTNVIESDGNIAFNKTARRSGPFLESLSVLITDKQSCIDDASVRGTAEVTKPYSVAPEQIATEDEVVEIISPPPRGDSSPFTTLDVEAKGNDEIPNEDAYKSPNSALRAELVRKIQATQERKAHEQAELKKKHLYGEKTDLDKKSDAVDFIVIDDD